MLELIIDVHTHAFPPQVANSAIPMMAQKAQLQPFADGTVSDLKRSMKQAGISHAIMLAIATNPTQMHKVNDYIASVQDEELSAFGSVHIGAVDWREEVRRIARLGLKGIKLHPEYQDFYVDDPKMFPLYEAIGQEGLILAFHCGVDLGYSPPVHATPQRIANALHAMEGMRVLLAHMGGFKLWDDVERYLLGQDVYLDTSFSLPFMRSEQFKRMIRAHGADRILFGSDAPWDGQGLARQRIEELNLEDEMLEKIMYRNAKRLLWNV